MKKAKNILGGLRYAFTVMNHPVQGFYDLRFERAGSLISSTIWLGVLILSYVSTIQYTGFIFNFNNVKSFNIIYAFTSILLPLIIWCVANWSITVLMDGEGRFRDIYMAICYASVPYSLSLLLCVVLSLFLTKDELTFLSIVQTLGLLGSALLVFTGTMTIHQFTVRKTVFSILLSLAGMVFIIFLAILFASILDKLFSYVVGIITEIKLRM